MNNCGHKQVIRRIIPHVGNLYTCDDCGKKLGDVSHRSGRGRFKRAHSRIIEAATVVRTINEPCPAGQWCPEHGRKSR